MQHTTDRDERARRLAETIHSAYAQQASGSLHPQHEQTLLTRLAEAIVPALASGTADEAVRDAANATLDVWERAMPESTGPRVARIDGDGIVMMPN